MLYPAEPLFPRPVPRQHTYEQSYAGRIFNSFRSSVCLLPESLLLVPPANNTAIWHVAGVNRRRAVQPRFRDMANALDCPEQLPLLLRMLVPTMARVFRTKDGEAICPAMPTASNGSSPYLARVYSLHPLPRAVPASTDCAQAPFTMPSSAKKIVD